MLAGQWSLPAGVWGYIPQDHPVLGFATFFPPMGIRSPHCTTSALVQVLGM